jgi:hypothetical protein
MSARLHSIRRQLTALVICFAALLSGCREHREAANSTRPTSTSVQSYSTRFPLTENPISEGERWLGGSNAGTSLRIGENLLKRGRLWGDVQTLPGFAYGVDEPTKYGDPTAVLAGTWELTQTASATVKINKTQAVIRGCCHEVELRLRTTISDKSITGYEAYCSVLPNQGYCHIARWNGPNDSYWNFETGNSDVFLVDGDVITATATGTNPTVITLYRNGTQVLQASDTGAAGGGFGAYGPWTSGNPGIGFFDNHDDNWKDFGFSSFEATNGISNVSAHASVD